jgi:hypothetical protein
MLPEADSSILSIQKGQKTICCNILEDTSYLVNRITNGVLWCNIQTFYQVILYFQTRTFSWYTHKCNFIYAEVSILSKKELPKNFHTLFVLSALNYTYIWRILTVHIFASVAGRYHPFAVPELIHTEI